MASHKLMWDYAHSFSVLAAVLLFLAGFLCTLLWINGIVTTAATVASPETNTLAQFSPVVNTFQITYSVAIFGTVWNSALYATLIILGRDTLPIATTRLRYDLEKAACTVAVVGNAVYAVACIALTAVLGQLAADEPKPPSTLDPAALAAVKAGAPDRVAGLGTVAAFAGLAGAIAFFTCFMDAVHMQYSVHADSVKYNVVRGDAEADKQA